MNKACMRIQPTRTLAARMDAAAAELHNLSSAADYRGRWRRNRNFLSFNDGSRGPPQLELYPPQKQKNTRTAYQVAFGHAARILHEAKQPFEAQTLHPLRCAFFAPGQKIDRRAHA